MEARRAALEKMLNKAAAHSTLQHDADLKLFLESESFNNDIKHKERKEPNLGESKGMFSSLGLGGSSSKFVEQDDVSSQPFLNKYMKYLVLTLSYSGSTTVASTLMRSRTSSKVC